VHPPCRAAWRRDDGAGRHPRRLRNVTKSARGASTTTLESKTNFLAPAAVGTTVRAECVAIHRGRRTMVWQTRITSEAGKLLAIVTQTQMVLQSEPTK
jgi:uncharacterized protein (TIGR00369 family)